jgi:hypothetical protein
MFRYVSCWPAKEAVGRSSAVALERTAYAACSPSRTSARVIAAARSSGIAIPSRVRRISALSVRIAAGRRPSSRRSQPARGCLRSAKAPLDARPYRQLLRPASGRSPGDPARSCPSVHLPNCVTWQGALFAAIEVIDEELQSTQLPELWIASLHLDDQANHGRVNKAHQAELGILALTEYLDCLAGPFECGALIRVTSRGSITRGVEDSSAGRRIGGSGSSSSPNPALPHRPEMRHPSAGSDPRHPVI